MLEKLAEQISKINKISKYIFKYGLLACLLLFIFINYEFNVASTLEEVLVAQEIAGVTVDRVKIQTELSFQILLFQRHQLII